MGDTDPASEVAPQTLVGARVDDVVGSWYIDQETGVAELLDVWIHAHGIGYVRFHAHNGLAVTMERPHSEYEMPELHGTVEVQPGTPAPLAAIAGGRIQEVRTLRQDPPGHDVGYVIETGAGKVAIADVGDDLAVGEWPDPPRWTAAGIAVAR